jgi:hypothetical protein
MSFTVAHQRNSANEPVRSLPLGMPLVLLGTNMACALPPSTCVGSRACGGKRPSVLARLFYRGRPCLSAYVYWTAVGHRTAIFY